MGVTVNGRRWNPADHPRDHDGQFTDHGGTRRAGARLRPPDVAAARAADVQVTAATNGDTGRAPTREERKRQLEQADNDTLRALMEQHQPGAYQMLLDADGEPPPRSLMISQVLSGERRAGLTRADDPATPTGMKVRDQATARQESANEAEYRAQVQASEDRRAALIAMGRPALLPLYEAATGETPTGNMSKQWLASGIVHAERRQGVLPPIRAELVPERIQMRLQREARERARRR